MIKKWLDFKLNELNFSTYDMTAAKLSKLGGKHKERASKIRHWGYLSSSCRDIGLLNMNFNLQSFKCVHWKTKAETHQVYLVPTTKMISKIDKREPTIVKNGPIPVYILDAYILDPEEMYDGNIKEMFSHFEIQFNVISEECEYPASCFLMTIAVEWIGDTFKLVPGSAEITDILSDESDVEGIALFSDRSSAVKFRNKFLDGDNLKKSMCGLEPIREFFMEYAYSAEEWKNLFKYMREIPINKLYK
jgi:hypothetical protein